MSLLPYLIVKILWVSVGLMVELKTRNLLEAFLRDDSEKITETLVGLCHQHDTGVQEIEAFCGNLLVDKMKAADREMPSRFHARRPVVLSKQISASNSLFQRIVTLVARAFEIEFVCLKHTIGCHLRHQLDELHCVIVILVDKVSQFWRNGEE